MNTNDPILEALADWEAADDDLHAAHFASAKRSGRAYLHGWNSTSVTEARIQKETAHRNLAHELADAGSIIAGVGA